MLRDLVTHLTKVSLEASLKPNRNPLKLTALCIILGMTDDERKSTNQMFQRQDILIDNVLFIVIFVQGTVKNQGAGKSGERDQNQTEVLLKVQHAKPYH